MAPANGARFRQVFPAILAAVVAVSCFPLLATDGWVFRQSLLDFHFLTWWIFLICALLILGRAAAIFQEVLLARLNAVATQSDDDAEAVAGRAIGQRAKLAAAFQALAEGLALTLLASAIIAAVPKVPIIFSARSGGFDLASLQPYLEVFDSLLLWAIAVLAMFVVARSAKEIWPAYRNCWEFPRRRLLVLTAMYILLADDGLFFVALDLSAGPLVPLLALAIALPFLSSTVRNVIAVSPPRWVGLTTRVLLPVFDCVEIALLLAFMVALPSVADRIPEERYGASLETIGPYLGVLDTLALWSIILFVPFILARAVAVFRREVGEVLGFPIGRIIAFGAALLFFSGAGLLPVAFGPDLTHLLVAVGAALLLSYLVLILRRLSTLGVPGRLGYYFNNVLPLISAVVAAISLAMVARAVLDASPSIIAPFLDSERTTRFGEAYLPLIASLYEARETLAGFIFAFSLTLALPHPLWSSARWHLRPMLVCVGFCVSGYLAWISGEQISGVGHAASLVGAILGIGLFALGLSQLATYVVNFSEPSISGAASWLRGSSQRAFWIGAAIACYGMLMRPLIYETLWFAEIYEWVVLMALTGLVLLKIRSSFKSYVLASEAVPPTWNRWRRHRQQFVHRPDPRQELVSRWRQRFVEQGEWASLWAYLMELLHRNGLPPDAAGSVIRPLRESNEDHSGKLPWQRGEQINQRRRGEALETSLNSVEEALARAPVATRVTNRPSLEREAEQYIETGKDPEAMAALLIDSYQQRGAELVHAINLWFPLVNSVDRPPRWFDPPWVRQRKRRETRERRERLVGGAVGHLSGQLPLPSLPVAVAARSLAVFPSSTASAALGPSAVISSGQSFEVLRDQTNSILVRTGNNVEGFIHKSALQLQPILPGDEAEVNGAYERS